MAIPQREADESKILFNVATETTVFNYLVSGDGTTESPSVIIIMAEDANISGLEENTLISDKRTSKPEKKIFVSV